MVDLHRRALRPPARTLLPRQSFLRSTHAFWPENLLGTGKWLGHRRPGPHARPFAGGPSLPGKISRSLSRYDAFHRPPSRGRWTMADKPPRARGQGRRGQWNGLFRLRHGLGAQPRFAARGNLPPGDGKGLGRAGKMRPTQRHARLHPAHRRSPRCRRPGVHGSLWQRRLPARRVGNPAGHRSLKTQVRCRRFQGRPFARAIPPAETPRPRSLRAGTLGRFLR